MHMVEHLLLGDIAALLIVLGLTGPLLAPVLKIRFFDRLRALSHPAIAFPLWTIDLYVWHAPALYQAALRHTGIHALEHAMFLGFGINMWMCLFGPLPMPTWFGNLGRLIYIVAVRLAGTVLGNIFLWSGKVFYPFYLHGDAVAHISPLADQNLAAKRSLRDLKGAGDIEVGGGAQIALAHGDVIGAGRRLQGLARHVGLQGGPAGGSERGPGGGSERGPRPGGGRPSGGPGGRGKFFRRKKVCKFCTEKIDAIPYRDVRLLQGFVAERGKIVPRRLTGVCTTHQRRLTRAIKQARNIALLPFAARY